MLAIEGVDRLAHGPRRRAAGRGVQVDEALRGREVLAQLVPGRAHRPKRIAQTALARAALRHYTRRPRCPEPEWRNWQTRGTQNPETRKGRVGSIPTSGTNSHDADEGGCKARSRAGGAGRGLSERRRRAVAGRDRAARAGKAQGQGAPPRRPTPSRTSPGPYGGERRQVREPLDALDDPRPAPRRRPTTTGSRTRRWRRVGASASRTLASTSPRPRPRAWTTRVETVFVNGIPVQQQVRVFEETDELRQAQAGAGRARGRAAPRGAAAGMGPRVGHGDRRGARRRRARALAAGPPRQPQLARARTARPAGDRRRGEAARDRSLPPSTTSAAPGCAPSWPWPRSSRSRRDGSCCAAWPPASGRSSISRASPRSSRSRPSARRPVPAPPPHERHPATALAARGLEGDGGGDRPRRAARGDPEPGHRGDGGRAQQPLHL